MRRNAENTSLGNIVSVLEDDYTVQKTSPNEDNDFLLLREKESEGGAEAWVNRWLGVSDFRSHIQHGQRARWHSVTRLPHDTLVCGANRTRWEVVYKRGRAVGQLKVSTCWESLLPLDEPG